MTATLTPHVRQQQPSVKHQFVVAILHEGLWFVNTIRGGYSAVRDMAMDTHSRTGLVVQVRDTDGTVLFEANDEP